MTLVRYEPWGLTQRAVALLPRVDVREEADRYVVEADLPGVAPADIEVTAEHDVLTIRAERKSDRREVASDATPVTRPSGAERGDRIAGVFVRRFTLPEDADPNAINARSTHGVLELSIAKHPKRQPKRITVEAA
jgi:HSP20 family protein